MVGEGVVVRRVRFGGLVGPTMWWFGRERFLLRVGRETGSRWVFGLLRKERRREVGVGEGVPGGYVGVRQEHMERARGGPGKRADRTQARAVKGVEKRLGLSAMEVVEVGGAGGG